MNGTILRALLDMAIFLGTSDDDLVDPDAAVSQLELLSENLKSLTAQDRRDFVRGARAYSKDIAVQGMVEASEFVSELADSLEST